MTKYRIVKTKEGSFSAESRPAYWPFWSTMKGKNTHSSVANAREWVFKETGVIIPMAQIYMEGLYDD